MFSSNTTALSNPPDGFDLPAYLLGRVYDYMDQEEILGFDMHTAQDIAHDMALDGLEAEPAEIFGIISEFIEQDSGKE
ncbi:MAG: hypothetical protein IKP40_09980 [Clostridia bacterium]|nr:hypothetical protein [Clostridia bacterium]